MLPRVKIVFENGLIGSTSPSDDGVVGMIAGAQAVAGLFELDKAYLITKLEKLKDLGITAANNAALYKAIGEFYTEAPEGSKLWIYGVLEGTTMADMVDKDKEHAKTLLNSAKGGISILIPVKREATGYTPTIVDGLDGDVYAAMTKAQALGEWATEILYAPLFTILEGRHYSGAAADLKALGTYENNRVAILIGDTAESSIDACVGLLAGRIASIPVQRSVARVKTGAIKVDNIYIGGKTAENGEPDTIHAAGYITARTFVGKAGYYWSDDLLATKPTDDYALIPRRRVIDKAYRITYQTLIEELADEIPITDSGTIPAPIIKNLQNRVESVIVSNMTAYGNLGVDPSDSNDIGVECYIDPVQNIAQSNRLQVQLRAKPHGYSKYIDVSLGLKTQAHA